MPKRSHNFTVTEIKAGLLMLVSIAAFIIMFGVVANLLPSAEGKTYYVYMTDTGGLDAGADVRFGGYKVGKVEEMGLAPDSQTTIEVRIEVDEGTPVNAASTAFITAVSLTSAYHLEISTGEEDAALLEPGSEIPAEPGGLFGQIAVLTESMNELLDDFETLVGVEGYALPEEASLRQGRDPAADAGKEELVTAADLLKTVEEILENGQGLVGDVSEILDERRVDLEAILADARELTETAKEGVEDVVRIVEENEPQISGSLDNVYAITEEAKPIVDDVQKVTAQLDQYARTLESILANADSLSADAQGLLEDNRPMIDDLLAELEETLRYMKIFTRTIAEQPQSLLRGKEN